MVDFNNDNIEDLVIGAPGEAPEGGRKSGFVFVFSRYFRSNGFYTEELIPSQGLDQRTLDANENGDLFGEALGAGDFNGDGFDDLAVGAPGEAPGPDSKSGAAFVFNGTSSGLTPVQELDQGELDANENGDLFGKALGAGDFNGDGFDDLA
ncbi:MAG: integrin alpha, partial [Cyanobacteria bacterium P01_E01_bin.35]